MYLYKLEIAIEGKLTLLITVAASDEKAFEYVEGHIARYFIRTPKMDSIAIIEKKRLDPGAGYVIETDQAL
jgi:hypothetical protein